MMEKEATGRTFAVLFDQARCAMNCSSRHDNSTRGILAGYCRPSRLKDDGRGIENECHGQRLPFSFFLCTCTAHNTFVAAHMHGDCPKAP